jgi:hypothetical protein
MLFNQNYHVELMMVRRYAATVGLKEKLPYFFLEMIVIEDFHFPHSEVFNCFEFPPLSF